MLRLTLKMCLALVFIGVVTAACQAQMPAEGNWTFAVSGDSRNCGDIVMPAMAQAVKRDGASFYWHLGDYRAIYKVDEDYLQTHPGTSISDYFSNAWPDFIQHQIQPFGDLPVFLAPGNHEMVAPMNRPAYIAQFADWLDAPVIHKQRLADDASDHRLKTYYHWMDRGVDFISMDNATSDEFDQKQVEWLQHLLDRDAANPALRTVVMGMHAALPDSLSAGHSMNDSPQELDSGRKVYAALLKFRNQTNKNVYVLASHSHFVMDNVYAVACREPGAVLPGWIVGSAGAERYRLPAEHSAATVAQTDVYGYLLATVAADGKIAFQFREVPRASVPDAVVNEFSKDRVDWCFNQNHGTYQPQGANCACTIAVGATQSSCAR